MVESHSNSLPVELNKMKPFIACTFVALLSEALAAPDDNAKWETFKAKHGKRHPPHEESVRLQRFLERDAEIEAHNARYAAGLESFSRQHTRYSDLSEEELNRSAFGLMLAVNASEIPMADTPLMPSAVTEFDWRQRNALTPVKDQENCGSCYAFAAVGVLESMIKRKTGITVDLSEQDIIDCSYKVMMNHRVNNGCTGGWPDAVYEYYNKKDLVDEQSYPYTSGRTRERGRCKYSSPVKSVLKGRLIHKYVKVRDEEELASLLMSKGPLVIGMAADGPYKKMFVDLGDGIFDMDSSINLEANHAVVLVGFGVRDNEPYWVIRNSWGQDWGVGGYGKIARGKNMCNIMEYGVFYVDF